MSKLKNIKFELDIQGRGIINYAGDEEKFIPGIGTKDKNRKYAKKAFYIVIDKEGNRRIEHKLKISSGALRAGLFSESYIAHSPSIIHNVGNLYAHLGTDVSNLRGYLYTSKRITLKRSSPLCITPAIQTCNAMSIMETCSQSGEKKIAEEGKVKDPDEKKGITFFKKDTVGDIEYLAKGAIDLQGIELISCDYIFDRLGFEEDEFERLNQYLKMSGTNGKLGTYKYNNNIYEIGERAFQLNPESKIRIIKKMLNLLLDYSVYKNGGYAETKELRIQMIYDTTDTEAWVTISSRKDIENLFENVELMEFYHEVDAQEEIQRRIQIAAKIEMETKKSVDTKAAENAAKKQAREDKKSKND